MPPSNRRPTSEEIEELSEAFKRDPGGEAASRLAAAFLALGRPRDALDVGAKALRFRPENLDARALVGEAFSALHQWDRAKDELLKVVKVDRSKRRAVRLLGEVLMRREDYQRALPILQHAHNLDPDDPEVLDLLKRARSARPPDPAPPIPTPTAPAPSKHRPRQDVFADEPTRQSDLGEALARMDVEKVAVSSKPAPVDRPAGADPRASEAGESRRVEHHQPPPPESPLAPLGGGESGPARRPESGAAPAPAAGATLFGAPPVARAGDMPPAQGKAHPAASEADPGPGAQGPVAGPQGPESGGLAGGGESGPVADEPAKAKPQQPAGDPAARPRVFSADKPVDAAQGALREAAAVGEQYLNHLLTSGLLYVPNVRSPDVVLEVPVSAPWRRSWRVFAYLFVLLAIGGAATGGWYYYSEQQRESDVERHLTEARQLIHSGAYVDVRAAVEETERAMERAPASVEAMAAFAEVGGLAALLYRIVGPDDVRLAADRASRDLDAESPAYRSILVGRAAVTIASLDTFDDATDRLTETREKLESWLDGNPDDHVVRWLLGQALWAAGERAAAREAFEGAHEGGDGVALATLALADLALDDGDFERAEELYGRLVDDGAGDEGAPEEPAEGDEFDDFDERPEDAHDLALVGLVLANSERSVDDPFEEASDAFDVLSIDLAAERGARLEAYKQAAEAAARLLIEDYDRMREAIDASLALEVREPRLLARLGLGRIAEGAIDAATDIRTSIRWYGEEPERDPLVAVLDAELLLAQGRPARALAELEGRTDLRARRVRGRAHLASGDYARAAEELEAARAIAPSDFEVEVWSLAVTLASAGADEREEASEELRSIARGSRSRAAHYARGVGFAEAGDRREARRAFSQSLERISSESPNPLAYKAHTALARYDLADGAAEAAIEHLRAALEHNGAYLPAHELMGTLLVDVGEDEAALDHLVAVVEAGVAAADTELAYARALWRSGGAESRDEAAGALRRAAEGDADREALAELAESLGDEDLAEELDL